MPLPVVAVRNWLRGAAVEVADIEGPTGQAKSSGQGRKALRWCGPEAEGSRVLGPDELRPGDTLVVPSEYGGADAFGWNPESGEPVADVGDLCVNDMANAAPGDGAKLIRLRLHRGFEAGLVPSPTPDEQPRSLPGLVQEVRGLLEQGEDADASVEELLAFLVSRPPAAALQRAVVGQLAAAKTKVAAYPAGVVLAARVRPGFFRPGARSSESEDDSTDVDDASSLRAGADAPAAVELGGHADGVVRWAKLFAAKLGVDEDFLAVLAKAAHLHDVGKADWRFQFLLYGDEPGETLLAKSGREWHAGREDKVRQRAGLPRGFRHEFVSVALVRNHAGQLLGGLTGQQRGLVEYLVGTHHGRGRPFVPVIEDREPEQVSLQWGGHPLSADSDHGLWRLDSGWADSFWGLVRRYGYWGLAYLEALLRLADAACSAEEQRQGRKS
jgi:CRISPR-associated endonuclease/helicase Cas3